MIFPKLNDDLSIDVPRRAIGDDGLIGDGVITLRSGDDGYVDALKEARRSREFNPHQPRKPGGKGGGQWAKVGGGSGDTQAMHSTDGVYTAERAGLHREIIDHFTSGFPSQPPGKRVFLFAAGGPASGKSSTIGGPNAPVKVPQDSVHVDPDAIKLMLPEYKTLLDGGDPAARKVAHEESADIARAIVREAQAKGQNLFVEGQGDSEPGRFRRKLENAYAAGYKVRVAYVTIPTAEAVKRAQQRQKHTGRLADEKAVAKYHAGASARFNEIVQMAAAGKIDDLTVHDNRDFPNGDRKDPVKVAHLSGTHVVIDNPQLMKEFLAKGQRKNEDKVKETLVQAAEGLSVPVASPRQPFHSEEELYAHAKDVQDAFAALVDHGQGVDAALGADDHVMKDASDYAGIIKAIESKQGKAHVIIAPMKTAARAREKVMHKYGGDWSRLSDVVRGTVVVPRVEGLKDAMDAVRAKAQEKGWKVTAFEDRMVEVPGTNHVGPTPAGYADMSVRLESPEGLQTELQFTTVSLMVAKETIGHKLYEEQRTLATKPRTPENRWRIQELDANMREAYAAAWDKSV